MPPPPSDPFAYLLGLERLGMKFGLDNITKLCEALEHPERAFTSVLVAGTNGKGSVTAMVETGLRYAGMRTARYTSPHLVRLEERFVIDGKEVRSSALRDAVQSVQEAAESLVRRGVLDAPPTFFECTTAAAFELFRRAEIDIAVLEVGLGGRLDATNVVSPIATAITSIDFDHQAQLGDTLESIAREKAGIVKPGIPVVCGPLPAPAERVIREICTARGAPMVSAADYARIEEPPDGGAASVRTAQRSLDDVTLALAGRHQRRNAAVAIALLEIVSSSLARRISDAALRAALSRVEWPARLERFSVDGVDILLDAAHNPAGARALADYLRDIGWKEVTLLFGAMRDKDVRGMVAALAPLCSAIVCTTASGARAVPATELAEAASQAGGDAVRVEAVDDPAAALARAKHLGRPVVAAGSIFLIGPLRDILR